MSARDVLANTTWEDGERVGTYAANLILTALTAAGYAVVPREATEAMVAAGWIDKEDVNPDDIYRAMLAAGEGADDGR